jgi:NADH-quinone oxidoreductase subunit M
MYQRTMTGPGVEGSASVADLDRREVGVVAPLLLALVLFGFYPMPLLDVINPFVDDTLVQVGVSDPAPTVGAVEGGHQ